MKDASDQRYNNGALWIIRIIGLWNDPSAKSWKQCSSYPIPDFLHPLKSNQQANIGIDEQRSPTNIK